MHLMAFRRRPGNDHKVTTRAPSDVPPVVVLNLEEEGWLIAKTFVPFDRKLAFLIRHCSVE